MQYESQSLIWLDDDANVNGEYHRIIAEILQLIEI